MTKLDRWERLIRKHTYDAREGMGRVMLAGTVVHLLRLEHRWVVRMVKRIRPSDYACRSERAWGYQRACDDILAALEARRK